MRNPARLSTECYDKHSAILFHILLGRLSAVSKEMNAIHMKRFISFLEKQQLKARLYNTSSSSTYLTS